MFIPVSKNCISNPIAHAGQHRISISKEMMFLEYLKCTSIRNAQVSDMQDYQNRSICTSIRFVGPALSARGEDGGAERDVGRGGAPANGIVRS